MESISQDIRYAVRQLAKSPGFALVAIVSLALGIGATTAVYSVIHGILIDPYPYKDNDRMVHPVLYNEKGAVTFLQVNGSQYEEVKRVPTVDEAFATFYVQHILTGTAFPVTVDGGLYTPNTFQYFGVAPLLGREFTPADAPDGKPQPVVVLSYLFWKRQFAGQRDVIGKTIELDHKPYTIIGVLPPRFTWNDSDVYEIGIPGSDPKQFWGVFFKLKPGASRVAANAQLQPIVDEVAAMPQFGFLKGARIQVKGLNEWLVGQFKGTLLLLFCAVGLLLAVACSNVSILLLARGSARAHELAVRSSLGAARIRIIRQLLTESLLLSLVGTSIGIALAFGGIRFISAFLPDRSFPREAAITINAPVLLFCVVVALLVGVLFGIAPALQLSRPQIGSFLQTAGNRTSTTRQGRLTRRALVSAQVTITVLLLAGAGAAMRSLLSIIHEPLGYNPDHLLYVSLVLPQNSHPQWQDRLNAFIAAGDAIEHTQGVRSVGMSQAFFPPFGEGRGDVEILGQPNKQKAAIGLASPTMFAAMQVPLLQGRLFTEAESQHANHVAVVTQSFAKKFFPGGDAIGHSVRSDFLKPQFPGLVLGPGSSDWMQIVGVVSDVRNNGLTDNADPGMFVPISFVLANDMNMWVRTERDPDGVVNALRASLRKVSPDLLISEPHPATYFLETRGWGRERFVTLLFGAFSILALFLAAAGLYSVTSYGVALRQREFAVRLALGAHRSNLLVLALSSEAMAVAVGLAAGLGLSLALGKVLRTFAGGNSRDPIILLAAAALLALVATAAAMFPARRAAAVQPMQALRAE